jgi:pimeloyl-ACP methyl ester carboxylesterase
MDVKKIIGVVLGVLVISAVAQAKRPPFQPEPYWAPSRTVEVDGVAAAYLEAGTGPVLLLVHGWAGNIYNWKEVIGPLSQNFRVLAVDLPGSGQSGCDVKVKYTTTAYADFLAHFLDALKIPKASVLGNSMGGQVAAEFALNHPDRTLKLILCDAAGAGNFPGLFQLAGVLVTNRTVVPLIHLVFPVKEDKLAGQPESERLRVRLAEERYTSDARACTGRALAASMKSMVRSNLSDRLGQIQAPTLVIWGSNDDLLPVKTADIFAAKIPGASKVIITGGVHTPMQWRPAEFVSAITSFLGAE